MISDERNTSISDEMKMMMKDAIRDVLKESVNDKLALIQDEESGLKSEMASATVRLETIEDRLCVLEQVTDRWVHGGNGTDTNTDTED